MITLAKSRLPISNVAKMSLGKELRKVFISPQYCPRTEEHRACRQNISMGQQFVLCITDGYTRFSITCKDCKEDLATVYAKDKTLSDWRRLMYTSWHDRKHWFGLRGLNIAPKTNLIRIECSCNPEVRKTTNEFIIRRTK